MQLREIESVDPIWYHGTYGQMGRSDTFGGIHFGTKQAALDRLERTPSKQHLGRPKLISARIHPRRPLGSPEEPVDETTLFVIVNLKDDLVEVKKNHDAVFYQNIVEDPGSISVLVLDPAIVEIVGEESVDFEVK